MNLLQSLFGLTLASLPLLAASLNAGPGPGTSGEWLVYFGTYTGPSSQGIYVSRFNPHTGKISRAELAVAVANPSFLALHPVQPWLYAVSEVSQFDGKKTGAVSAFAVDRPSGKLKLLNQQPSGGDGPCHLTVDASGRAVLVANYGGGSCAVLPVSQNGQLSAPSAIQQHQGASVNPQRQQGPHAHGIYLDAANRFAFVPDLGLDQVLIYRFDPERGSLTPNETAFAKIAPGSGPRHLAFHPSGRFAYVINEMLCTITAFRYDGAAGKLEEVQTVSTLPPGEKVAPNYSTAEIEVHPSGKFLYGSNRGHNSVAVYALAADTGRLSLVQHQPTQGKTPRSFGIEPSGAFLLAANQDSDNVVLFRIDARTGRLAATGQSVSVGRPVCVKFLKAE